MRLAPLVTGLCALLLVLAAGNARTASIDPTPELRVLSPGVGIT